MKTRAALIRYYEWEVDEKRKVLAELFAAIESLEREAEALEVTASVEQVKATGDDVGQFSYPGFAQGVIAKRAYMENFRQDLENQIDAAKDALQLAYQELKKIEIMEDRRKKKEREQADQREQAELDEIAQNRHQDQAGN